MRILYFVLLMCFASVLIYGTFGLANQGDPEAIAHEGMSSFNEEAPARYYIREAYKDTKTPNIVTAILADYRSFDTLGEEVVILAAGMICLLLLHKPKSKADLPPTDETRQ